MSNFHLLGLPMFALLICNTIVRSQCPVPIIAVKDSIVLDNNDNGWFKQGNIDFISSGMIRSSTQLFKINIGNPKKFYLPFYCLIGATMNVFKEKEIINETALVDLLNSKGGLINFGFSGDLKLNPKAKITNLYFTYQVAAKSVSGIRKEYGDQVNFLSKMINTGLMVKSYAWKDGDEAHQGKAWLKGYTSCSINDKSKLNHLFSKSISPILMGVNIEGGVAVKDYINLQFGFHRYINNLSVEEFKTGILKFAAHFSFK